jgi:hypothetical protein
MKEIIIPELKSLISPDLPNRELPDDPEDSSVLLEANIGPKNKNGSDIFSFRVVTRKRLANESGAIWGHGMVVLDRFSWQAVESTLQKLLMHCYRPTWEEVANQINKYLDWEFDNYTEKGAG